EDGGFLLRSQLSKLQLAVQNLSKENSRLKLENELLLKHALPPPPRPSPPTLPYPCHTELMQPGHSDFPPPPRHPTSMQHAPPPLGFEMQSALEEVRMLQQRLELLKGRLNEEEERAAPLPHPQCYPPSPQPGGSTDFFDLVEQLNGCRGRQSPNRPQHSSPQLSPRPGWRSPNALPRSPVHPVGTSPHGHGRQCSPSSKGSYNKGAPCRTTAKGGAQKMKSPSRIPFSNISNGRGSASGARKSARLKSHQNAVNARLHYGIPSKQW
ncbi:hypothetical protein DUNSADRAFT_9879, partial [Dunaliella salina]